MVWDAVNNDSVLHKIDPLMSPGPKGTESTLLLPKGRRAVGEPQAGAARVPHGQEQGEGDKPGDKPGVQRSLGV